MDAKNLRDDELLTAFSQGMLEGFNLLYSRFSESVYFFVYNLAGDKETAEDITADTFVKLWQKKDLIKDYSNIKTYLFTTARNCFIDYYRRSAKSLKNKESYSYYHTGDEELPVLHSMIRTEFMQEVFAAMDKLPPQCSKIIKMTFINGMDNHEIAAELNLSVNTIRGQKQRGINLLRKIIRLSIFFILFF